MQSQEQLSVHAFTRAELIRLADYRAAVRAGFYSERLGRRRRRPGNLSRNSSIPLRELDAQQYMRLEALRDAIEAGLFGQDDRA